LSGQCEQRKGERYPDVLKGVQVWTDAPTVAELNGFAALVETADELRDAS
jgi:hypothetical protein